MLSAARGGWHVLAYIQAINGKSRTLNYGGHESSRSLGERVNGGSDVGRRNTIRQEGSSISTIGHVGF